MNSIFTKIYEQNPWFMDFRNIHEDVHLARLNRYRYIWREKSFLEYHFEDGIYFLYGPRQIGKSTLLKMFIQDHITSENSTAFFYFNCDFLDSKKEIVELVEVYLSKIPKLNQRIYILLDEITSIHDGILGVKFLVDSGKSKNITYILSGSSSVNIKKTGEYLPGRRAKGIDFVLIPLSFSDFLNLQYTWIPSFIENINDQNREKKYYELTSEINLPDLFDDYLMCGGIPRVINEFYKNQEIDYEIQEIYKNWISSEVAKHNKKEYLIKIILNRISLSLGSTVSYNSFLQDAGIGSHNTVHDYLDFLENAYIINQLYHFDFHQQKVQYRKNKKIYFIDSYIGHMIDWWVNSRVKLNSDFIKNNLLASRIVENVVFNNLKRIHGEDLYFYRNNFEIDFVSKNNWMIEVKYQNKIIKEDYSHLTKLNKKFKIIVVSKNDLFYDHPIDIIPVAFFLLIQKRLLNHYHT
ncbi:MAG: ATP-binding protein [bacterium]